MTETNKSMPILPPDELNELEAAKFGTVEGQTVVKVQIVGGNMALDDLSDVEITNVQPNDIIRYNETTAVWENQPLAASVDWTNTTQNLSTTGSGTFNDMNTKWIDLTTGLADPTYQSGRIFYDNANNTLCVYSDVANTSLQVGQEQLVRAVNNTGGTLTDGTVVYISGAQGNRPTIGKADADNTTSDKTIGVVTADILNNAEGYVCTGGVVRNFNTSGFTTGDELFVSETAGVITNVRPTHPDHDVRVGWALNSTANGSILVAPHVPSELSGLHDVLISAVQDNQFLQYDSATGLWKNETVAAGGVTDHGALTGLADDDHTQYALLAGRVGHQTLIGSTASAGTLTLQSTSHGTKGKINLGTSAYDEANNRLGLGTASPSYNLHVSSAASTAYVQSTGASQPAIMTLKATGVNGLELHSRTTAGSLISSADGLSINPSLSSSISKDASVETGLITVNVTGADSTVEPVTPGFLSFNGTLNNSSPDQTDPVVGSYVCNHFREFSVTSNYATLTVEDIATVGIDRPYAGANTAFGTTLALKVNGASRLGDVNATNFMQIDSDGGITMPKASGIGMKIDPTSPAFGWKDLLGDIKVRGSGANDPSWATYRNGIKQYQFTVNDECWSEFHIPHDYAPGSNIYIHAHWSHASAGVTSGGVTWGFEVTYAKGHNQAAFPATVSPTIQQNASTTQYQHMIAEVQLSASTPSGTQIDSDNLEVDGLILVRTYLSGNTINGTPEPFLHFVDIHYQSTNVATKNKAPGFYT